MTTHCFPESPADRFTKGDSKLFHDPSSVVEEWGWL